MLIPVELSQLEVAVMLHLLDLWRDACIEKGMEQSVVIAPLKQKLLDAKGK